MIDGADATQPATWQYPLSFDAALTIEPAQGQPGWICRPERIFAAATPAWGLSQADVAAARTHVTRGERALTAAGGSQHGGTRAGTGTAAGTGTGTATGTGDAPPADGAAGSGTVAGSGPGSPAIGPEDGVAEAFVDLLRHEAVPPVEGFRVVRLVPPPEATGERPVEGDCNGDSVVVGERVVVTWVRTVRDSEHAAPRMLAHLDAVDFFGVPETHGVLLWTAPSGREVPVAWATKYLPRARDGWDWCVDLTQRALGLDAGGPPDSWVEDYPARLGRLAAKLHVALATASKVVPEPVDRAGEDLIHAWHAVATQALDRAVAVARTGSLEGVADVLLPRLPALTAAVDQLLTVAADEAGHPLVQRIHGDLHVGQVLRWPGGLAVVDFHPHPVLEFADLRVGQAMQPAARDLARLMRSLDHVGRVADKSSGFTTTHAVDRWSRTARTQLLEAYRAELASADRSELLDERLLAPFEAEQLCRELVYADEFLPAWAYAPLGGLWQDFPATDAAPSGTRRGRHAQATAGFAAPRG